MIKPHLPRLILAAFLIVATCSITDAYMTVDQYKESTKNDELSNTDNTNHYVMGVANGFIAINITLKDRGDKPLYCQPETLTLPVSFYVQLIDKMIEEPTLDPKAGVEFILLFMLQNAFPCEKKP